MAVGAVFRLAEVIAVMRIDSGEVFLDFAGLRILHARNVVETVGFLGQLILIVASLALLGFNRFKLAGSMTLCAHRAGRAYWTEAYLLPERTLQKRMSRLRVRLYK